jgi:hypothetical protein
MLILSKKIGDGRWLCTDRVGKSHPCVTISDPVDML